MPLQRLETTAGERVPGSLERFNSAVNDSLEPAIAIARYTGVRSPGTDVEFAAGTPTAPTARETSGTP